MGSDAAGRHCRATAGIAGALVLAAACASALKVDTETYDAGALAQQRTFAWAESLVSDQTRARPGAGQALHASVARAVIEELKGKGYVEASAAAPDFLVSFHVVVTEEPNDGDCVPQRLVFGSVFDSVHPLLVCVRNSLGTPAVTRAGTLVVFVVDVATRSLLWQATAAGAVAGTRDATEKSVAAVHSMFATFPLHTS